MLSATSDLSGELTAQNERVRFIYNDLSIDIDCGDQCFCTVSVSSRQ
jgi:hypothetical protein